MALLTPAEANRALTRALAVSVRANDGCTPREGDALVNDTARALVGAMACEHGRAWLGIINRGSDDPRPWMWEWDGAPLTNFGADFVLPARDEELERLLALRDTTPYTSVAADSRLVEAILDRVTAVGGFDLYVGIAMPEPRDFNPLARRVATARARCDLIGGTIVTLQQQLVAEEREYAEACNALDCAIREEGMRALASTSEPDEPEPDEPEPERPEAVEPEPRLPPPTTMPGRVLHLLWRHPGEKVSTREVAERLGTAKRDSVYAALRRLSLKRGTGIKRIDTGLWRYERPARTSGEARLRVVGDGYEPATIHEEQGHAR